MEDEDVLIVVLLIFAFITFRSCDAQAVSEVECGHSDVSECEYE